MMRKNKMWGAGFRTLRSLQSLRPHWGATNKRVSGYGALHLRPNPRSARTSDTRWTLCTNNKFTEPEKTKT